MSKEFGEYLSAKFRHLTSVVLWRRELRAPETGSVLVATNRTFPLGLHADVAEYPHHRLVQGVQQAHHLPPRQTHIARGLHFRYVHMWIGFVLIAAEPTMGPGIYASSVLALE